MQAAIVRQQRALASACCCATRAASTSASCRACRIRRVSQMELNTAQQHPTGQYSAFPDSCCSSCTPRPSSWWSTSSRSWQQ